MNIELTYAEMSFLRELVQKERLEVWRRKWLHKGMSKEEVDTLWERLFRNPVYPDGSAMPLTTNEGCIGSLLHKFGVIEQECRKILGMLETAKE